MDFSEKTEEIKEQFIYPKYLYNIQSEIIKIYHDISEDVFLKLFAEGKSLRNSCYNCKYTNKEKKHIIFLMIMSYIIESKS